LWNIKKNKKMVKQKELYKDLKPFLNCIDYTVSKEMYGLMLNKKYEMLVTSPIPEDLENYYISENYISHTDKNKTLFEKIYQTVKNYTLKKKVSLLDSFKTEEKTVLDVGAGTGEFLHSCKKKHWKIFGVEPNLDASRIAAKKGIFLKEKLSEFKDQKFDVITLWHVLEHIENLSEEIESLKKLLKDKGTLVVAVPNYKSHDAEHYKQYWAAFDVPRHVWHFSQNSITKLFSQVSMHVVKTIPMKFDAYYVSLLSEKYKSGVMNPIKSFWRGFQSNTKAKRTSEYSSLTYVIKNT